MTEFLADLQQGPSPEDIRALENLRDGSYELASEQLARLVEHRLAWVGPPPAGEIGVSYRGRHALREAEAVVLARSGFASALKNKRAARR